MIALEEVPSNYKKESPVSEEADYIYLYYITFQHCNLPGARRNFLGCIPLNLHLHLKSKLKKIYKPIGSSNLHYYHYCVKEKVTIEQNRFHYVS